MSGRSTVSIRPGNPLLRHVSYRKSGSANVVRSPVATSPSPRTCSTCAISVSTTSTAATPDIVIEPTPEEPVILPRQPVQNRSRLSAHFVAPPSRVEALRAIQLEIGDCTRCALSTGRNKIVFGDGDPQCAPSCLWVKDQEPMRTRRAYPLSGRAGPTAQQHDRRHRTEP